jgi:hypothetical protein
MDASGVSGWGLDIPVLVGWRSDAQVIQVWVGPRAGVEHDRGHLVLSVDPDPTREEQVPLDAWRWYGGGVIGLAGGAPPVWVGVELDVYFQTMKGRLNFAGTEERASLDGITLAPTGALLVRF